MAEKFASVPGSNAGKLLVVYRPGMKIFGQFVVNILELAE